MATGTDENEKASSSAQSGGKPSKKAAVNKTAKPSKKAKTPKKKTAKKRKGGGKDKKDKKDETGRRVHRPYPMVAFSQATVIGDAIHRYASGEKIRRLTLLEKLGMSDTSSSTRALITNSGKYGITNGSFKAEWIELTELGKVACDPNAQAVPKTSARFKLAVESIAPFKLLYDQNVGKKLVAREVMFDWFDEADFEGINKAECVDIFTTNVKELGLLRTIAGSEILVPIAQALEELPGVPAGSIPSTLSGSSLPPDDTTKINWATTCFYVTPIGKPGTPIRKHSDLFKNSIVEPAMAELNLKVIRADEIENAGMITSGILEHIKKSKLVVADLSDLNPNVFYEIALRHACKLPIVQIIRQGDALPFDIGQVNTITIDNSDLYTFVPQIPTFRAELATLARAAIENPERISNPITAFYPKFWEGMPTD